MIIKKQANNKNRRDKMQYSSLHELIKNSQSSRKFFLSLPVEIQYKLHEQNQYIHTASDLHIISDAVKQNEHLIKLGQWE